MTDKERLENISHIGFDLNGNVLLKSEDYHWLIEQAERVEELKKQLEQVKKAADFLLFQIGLARSISLIKAEFSGEEELYKALKEEI